MTQTRIEAESAPANQDRTTLRIGPATRAFLDSPLANSPDGASISARIEAAIARYTALATDYANFPTWPADAWAAMIDTCADLDALSPDAIYAITGRIKARKPHPKLAYAVESLTLPQLHVLLALIEHARASRNPVQHLRDLGVRIEG